MRNKIICIVSTLLGILAFSIFAFNFQKYGENWDLFWVLTSCVFLLTGLIFSAKIENEP